MSPHPTQGNSLVSGHRASIADHQSPKPERMGIVLLEEPQLYEHDSTDYGFGPAVAGFQPRASFQTTAPLAVDRLNNSHGIRNHGGGDGVGIFGCYAPHATPIETSTKRTVSIDTIPSLFGARRPGGPVRLFSHDHIGLLLNWTVIGFLQGALAGLIFPLFGVYLHYSAAQMSAASTLIGSGWYYKFVLGFLTDTMAINRQRRKPYMLIGFSVTSVLFVLMALMHKVAWYGGPVVGGQVPEALVQNPKAPDQGIRYVIPLIVTSFARLLATVACEGMMVEFAHREGEFSRGRSVLVVIAFRFVGELFGGGYTALALSSVEFGGRFDHSIPLEWYFASLAGVAFIGIVATYYCIKEKEVARTSPSFGSSIRRVWRFLEQRVTTQIMVALFVVSCAQDATVVEYSAIYTVWFRTDSLTRSLVGILQSVGYILAAGAFYFWFLNTNWRMMVMAGFSFAFVIQFPIELLAVWDVVRSSALFLAKDWAAGVFEAVPWIIPVFVIVEAAEPDLESTIYGFLTTVCNLAGVMLSWIYSVVSSTWDARSTSLADDTDRVRWHITYEFIAKYAMRFAFALVAIAFLPRQKRHVKEIKIRGAPNLVIPVVLFVIVACLFFAAITSAVLSMFASTMCLPFAGGSGC